ncbi:hypothetical protein, partial [Promicromonospora kroppenstedtii]|uniref:hypothetical protein n=1 Tax=Promicromonospora kroppenstedtii TaxID=440482 RepID=UPI001B7F9052
MIFTVRRVPADGVAAVTVTLSSPWTAFSTSVFSVSRKVKLYETEKIGLEDLDDVTAPGLDLLGRPVGRL